MEATTANIGSRLMDMSRRIQELREIAGFTVKEMAQRTDVSEEEYLSCEAGQTDLSFAFLYRCAQALGVDVTDIIEGQSPRLAGYTMTRRGGGQRIEQAHGMVYYNLAPLFKNRIAEPLYVKAAYSEQAQSRPIEVTTHDGQECDIVISGSLKVQVGDHAEILHEGDSIYYDSSTPHGMIAVGGEDCYFYAIVLNPNGEPIPELTAVPAETVPAREERREEKISHIYDEFAVPVEDENGALISMTYKNTERFNFAFDILDALADREPDKLAMLHVSRDKTERRLTFGWMKKESARAANYFTSLGLKKGDRVLMVLRRNYQFWPIAMALNKMGVIFIPATDQLMCHDYEYRFSAGSISAVITTVDSVLAPAEIEKALTTSPTVKTKIIVSGDREGWHSFDTEYKLFRSVYDRTPDSPCGDDLMLMYFTSGTTGYPKLVEHSYKYPLGHLITAKYWQNVREDGLHLTISDTGWAKAMWGKLYGQWMAEAAIFVSDFDRFDADDIMPMFAKYGITTFCAPPTMYRMFIKQDLSGYDLSSIKHASTAGEALNAEVVNQFRKATGLTVMEGFGQSESTVMIGNLRGTSPKIGSMGKPVPIYNIDIVDADGNSVKAGETGEIVVRTKVGETCGLMVGYFGDPENTRKVWAGGMYHTGDTAWRDEDGYFWYVGRVDDVIKSSGYRIGPFEIESVLMEIPYILECGVSPAPDPVRGQVVKASIVLTKGTEPTEELKKEIQNYVKSRTAPYKYPRIIVFRDELPKTTSGKIQRSLL